VSIDVNRIPWRDVAEGNQALAEGGLETPRRSGPGTD